MENNKGENQIYSNDIQKLQSTLKTQQISVNNKQDEQKKILQQLKQKHKINIPYDKDVDDYDMKENNKKKFDQNISNYDWNQNESFKYVNYSGGFKIPEAQIKLEQQKKKQQEKQELEQKQLLLQNGEFGSDEQRKQAIMEKLGIQESYKGIQKDIPNQYLEEIQDKYIHSTKDKDVKKEVNTKLIQELEEKRQKLQYRREVLVNKNEHLQKIDELGQELAIDKLNKKKKREKQLNDPNNLINKQMLSIIEDSENKNNEKQKDDFDYFYLKHNETKDVTDREVRPVMDEIDQLLSNAWEEEKPSLDIVELKLREHRQKMRDIERSYQQKKIISDRIFEPQKGLYQDIEQDYQDFQDDIQENQNLQEDRINRDFDGLELKEIEENQNEDNISNDNLNNMQDLDDDFDKQLDEINNIRMPQKQLQQQQQNIQKNKEIQNNNMKKELTLEEREEKRLRIIKEMRALDREIDKFENKEEGQNNREIVVKPSQKVFENAAYKPKERRIFEQQFEEYKIDKNLKQKEEKYREQLDYPTFERYRRPEKQQKYLDLHPDQRQEQFPVTNRPQKIINNIDDLEKEQMQYQVDKDMKGGKRVKLDEQKRLFKNLMEDKNERAEKMKAKDEQFILKFLFQEIDEHNTKFVSKQEVYDAVRQNNDAIVFFDLVMDTFYLDLERLNTQRLGLLNFNEFTEFMRDQNSIAKTTLKAKKQFLEHQALEEQKKINIQQEIMLQKELGMGTCLLNDQEIGILKSLFMQVDEDQSGFIPRYIWIESIKDDDKTQFLLNLPCVKIEYTNQKLNMTEVLNMLQNQMWGQVDEYLTFNRFMQLLKNFKLELDKKGQENQQDDEQYSIKEEYLLIIQDIFDMVPRVFTDFVKVKDFIEQCDKDPQIRALKKEKANKNGDSIENIIFEKIQFEHPQEYIDFVGVKYYFNDFFDKNQVENRGLKDDHIFFIQKKQVQTQNFDKSNSKDNQILKNKVQRQNYQNFMGQVSQQDKIYQQDKNDIYSEEQFKQLNEIDQFNRKFYENVVEMDQNQNIDEQFFKYKRVIQQESQQNDEDNKDLIVNRQQLQQFDQFYKEMLKKEGDEGNVLGVQQQEEEGKRIEDAQVTTLKNHRVDYNAYFGKTGNSSKQNKKPTTVPKGPSMLSRQQQERIVDRRLKEELEAKQEEEKQYFQFKARPINMTTKVERMDTMKKENKLKQEQKMKTLELRNEQFKKHQPNMYNIDFNKTQEQKQELREKLQKEMDSYIINKPNNQQKQQEKQSLQDSLEKEELDEEQEEDNQEQDKESIDNYGEDEDFEQEQQNIEKEEKSDIEQEEGEDQDQDLQEDKQEEEEVIVQKKKVQQQQSKNKENQNKNNIQKQQIDKNNKKQQQQKLQPKIAQVLQGKQKLKRETGDKNKIVNKQSIINFFKKDEQQEKEEKKNIKGFFKQQQKNLNDKDKTKNNNNNQNKQQKQNQDKKIDKQQNNKDPIQNQEDNNNQKNIQDDEDNNNNDSQQNEDEQQNKEDNLSNQDIQEDQDQDDNQSNNQDNDNNNGNQDNNDNNSFQDDNDNNNDQQSNQDNNSDQDNNDNNSNQENNDNYSNQDDNNQEKSIGGGQDINSQQEQDNQEQQSQLGSTQKSGTSKQVKTNRRTSNLTQTQQHSALDVSKMTKVQKLQWEKTQKRKEEEKKKKEEEERKIQEKKRKQLEQNKALREKLGVTDEEQKRKKLEEERKAERLKALKEEEIKQAKMAQELKEKMAQKPKMTSKKLHGSSVLDKYRKNENYGKNQEDIEEQNGDDDI